jgi:hypothetical protein
VYRRILDDNLHSAAETGVERELQLGRQPLSLACLMPDQCDGVATSASARVAMPRTLLTAMGRTTTCIKIKTMTFAAVVPGSTAVISIRISGINENTSVGTYHIHAGSLVSIRWQAQLTMRIS